MTEASRERHGHSDEPAALLAHVLPLLPKGRALDLAMGHGRNALFLAEQGYEVEGLDRDAAAVAACRQAAEARGLRFSVRCVDLERHALAPDAYDVILCFYYLQRSLLPQIQAALSPGGVVVYETFLIDNHIRFGHPSRREYCFEHNELLRAFPALRVLDYREGLSDGGTFLASLIAQRPPEEGGT